MEIGKWEIIHSGNEAAILAVGSMVGMILDAKKDIYHELGYIPTIVNARFIKPLDEELLNEISKNHQTIITLEEGVLTGGFGSAVSAFLHENQLKNILFRIGIPDNFVEHGIRHELLHDLGLTPAKIISILNLKDVKELYEY